MGLVGEKGWVGSSWPALKLTYVHVGYRFKKILYVCVCVCVCACVSVRSLRVSCIYERTELCTYIYILYIYLVFRSSYDQSAVAELCATRSFCGEGTHHKGP